MKSLAKLMVGIAIIGLFLTASSASAPVSAAQSASGTLRFIEFYSPLWSACREALSIVNGLEQTYADRITFVRANILNPQSRPLMDEFGFSATPEFYLVDANDQVIGYWNDVVEADVLHSAFDTALNAFRRN